MDLDELAANLYDSISLIVRRLRQTPAAGELSLPERSALSRLDRSGPATAAELARAEQITPQAMGTTLASLEEHGFIERRADPADRRRVIMSVTESGLEVLRHKRSVRAQQLAASFADRFTQDELATLAAAVPLIERLGEGI